MDEEILRRIERKLDLVIELLKDGILTGDEVALLTETDEIVRKGEYQDFVKL